MATTNGSTAIRDKILASLARYHALRIGKFPCAFWRLSARPGLTANDISRVGAVVDNEVVDGLGVKNIPQTMLQFLAAGSDALDALQVLINSQQARIPLDEVKLLVPVPRPGKFGSM